MRYAFAIAALVISGVLLLLGIGQRTFLAGPAEIELSLEQAEAAPYAVIPADQLDEVPGQANIVLGGDAFVATGADRDVQAWVEPYDRVVLTADPGAKLLTAEETQAAPPDEGEDAAFAPIDPRGSDLWIEERSSSDGSGSLRVPVKLAEGKSVIVASDGEAPIPAEVSVVWVQDRDTPWAGPLLAAGGLFALIGVILYLLAVDRDRRGLGPQRGRRGPLLGIRNVFSRKGRRASTTSKRSGRAPMRAVLPALGLAAALGLSGCSASYWPQFEAAPEDAEAETTEAPGAVAPVPVTESQIDRIISEVSAVSIEADEELDAELLSERFTADALQQRQANYKIRAKIPDYGVSPPLITAEELDYQLVQSTEGWPRTLLLTVASARAGAETGDGEESASPSLALVLSQQTPHENFLVSRVIALRGGIEMPLAAPVEEGTALLADDLQSLMLPPGEVGAAFASLLESGEDSEYYGMFDLTDVTLLENYGQARAAKAQQEAKKAGTPLSHEVSAEQGEEPPVALSTGVGGALVATTVVEEQSVDSGGGRYKPQATGALTALSGIKGQQDRIVQVIEHQLLFFVPSKDDGGLIQLLGETSELVAVRK